MLLFLPWLQLHTLFLSNLQRLVSSCHYSCIHMWNSWLWKSYLIFNKNMCDFFFHKLFCLLENVIIPVFMISGKEDISDCRNCNNICVYFLLCTRIKHFRDNLKKQVESFLLGREGEMLLGFCLFVYFLFVIVEVLWNYFTVIFNSRHSRRKMCVVHSIF